MLDPTTAKILADPKFNEMVSVREQLQLDLYRAPCSLPTLALS